MGPRKSDGSFKEKRQLVRWDTDHDIMLLLTMQQVCNAQGIKLPWADIAGVMGPKFSEGAIIQHLAKLRLRRQGDGKQVPPPLRRSVAGSGSGGGSRVVSPKMHMKQKPSRKVNKRKAAGDSEGEEEDEGTLTESSDEEDPSYTLGFQKKEKHIQKRSRVSAGTKGRNSAGQDDHMIDAAYESASDGEVGNVSDHEHHGAGFRNRGQDSQQSPKDSKVVRLNVPQAALSRLQQTGSVVGQTSSDAMQSSPPSWPHHMASPHGPSAHLPSPHLAPSHLASPHEQFNTTTYPPGYGSLPSTVGHHEVYSGIPFGQMHQYQQPGNYGFVNPSVISSQSLSRPPEWVPQPSYPNRYPIPQMPATDQDWAQHRTPGPSWDATKQEDSDEA